VLDEIALEIEDADVGFDLGTDIVVGDWQQARMPSVLAMPAITWVSVSPARSRRVRST
jgi:hypothetical protein